MPEPGEMGTVFRGELASMLMAHVLGYRNEGVLIGRSEASSEILSVSGSLAVAMNTGR